MIKDTRYFIATAEDGTPRAAYRIHPGLAEYWTPDGWRESEDLRRRYWNGFDADVQEVSKEDSDQNIRILEKRRVRDACLGGKSANPTPVE